MSKEKITVTLDKEVVKELDKRKGITARATYLNAELRKLWKLDKKK